MLCCAVLYCTVLYCTVLYCTVLYPTVLYPTLLYCTLPYSTRLYCTFSALNNLLSIYSFYVRCRPHQCDYSGRNAVMIAAEHGHTAIVAVLITAGALIVQHSNIFLLLTFYTHFFLFPFPLLLNYHFHSLSSVD